MEASETTPAVISPAEQAAAAIGAAMARVQVTTGGGPGAVLPDVKFGRLSLERRVLAHVTDEVDESEFGPRNTLAALTRALMTDRNTTHPPTPEHGRLDVDGRSVVDVAQAVEDVLGELVDAGLVASQDGVYAVTDAGRVELAS